MSRVQPGDMCFFVIEERDSTNLNVPWLSPVQLRFSPNKAPVSHIVPFERCTRGLLLWVDRLNLRRVLVLIDGIPQLFNVKDIRVRHPGLHQVDIVNLNDYDSANSEPDR